jgi:hypothetical protein
MAGLGYKLFASGEVLTAANLQGYAVDQSVMSFATSAARTSALAAPSEGMVTYLADDDRIEVYDGTAYKIVYLPPTAYVPTATNYTRTSGSLYYSVAGHTLFITGRIIVSAVSGSIICTLPPGFTPNPTVWAANQVIAGTAFFNCATVLSGGYVGYSSATQFRMIVTNTAGTYAAGATTSSTVPGIWASGDSFAVNIQIPLA